MEDGSWAQSASRGHARNHNPLFVSWRFAPLVTCAVLATVRDQVTAATSVLLLVVWVVAAAAGGDRVAGVLAAVSAGAWFDFFLTAPYQEFTISDDDDVEAAVLLVVIGVAVSEIALWGSRQRLERARRSGYLDGLVRTAAAVAARNMPLPATCELIASHICEVLNVDDCRYVEGPVHDARIAVIDHEGILSRHGHRVDVGRVGLPTNEYVAVPVQRGPTVVGHFLVMAASHVAYPTREQRRVAVLLADQDAAAA